MRIDFVTIFPRMLDPFLAEGVIARGVKYVEVSGASVTIRSTQPVPCATTSRPRR